MTQGFDIVVSRQGLTPRIVTAPQAPLEDGCIRLAVDSFALTANNITYGVSADQLGYWDFFPTAEETDGRIPVWGFADIVESRHGEVPVGGRVYGFLPMSRSLDVRPGKVTPAGFTDRAPHRAERAAIYNQYSLCATDPLWREEDEALIALYRPLFTTSFLLDDLYRDNGYFGAAHLLIASASSKTAIGLARLAMNHAPGGVSVCGLTSAVNVAFCESLGCYDRVLTYEDISAIPQAASALVDMAGNANLRSAVHHHLGDNLVRSTAVGMTHWQASRGLSGSDLPGAKPSFFFAPHYAQDRLKHWGRDGFQARYADAWTHFKPFAAEHTGIQRASGGQAIVDAFTQMRDGHVDPAVGVILSPKGD